MDTTQKKMEAIQINTGHAKTTNNNKQLKDKEENIYPVEKDLLRPFLHLISIPGKHMRQNLVEALNYWLEIPEEKVQIITEIIFNFHQFTLLIDDIEDATALRRGAPAAHTIFGVTNTVNTSTVILAMNLDNTLSLNHPLASKTLTRSVLEIIVGQGLDIYWRDEFVCPTEEDYMEMVTIKGGGIFYMANNLMQLFSTKNKNLTKLLTNIGLYIQINNDYENLTSEVSFDSKGYCEDLTEGKFGFPIVHAINSHPKEGVLIMDILSQRTVDNDVKKRCVDLIEACGSFEYTRNKLAEIKRTIAKEIAKLGANPRMVGILEQITAASV